MIIITKVENFKEINKQLLSLIDKIPNNPLNDKDSSILHTDWNLPSSLKREYFDYFIKIMDSYIKKIAHKLNSNTLTIDNCWFQQYGKSHSHTWHTHPKSNFTNVYFVELPDKSLGTEILNHDGLDLKEGDLLTFPAYYYHRSPVNTLDCRKTIISFNSNVFDYRQ
jgi:hypothetical protein